jgi:hypothetical protein
MASQDSVGGRRLKLLQAAREAHVEIDSLLWRLLRERGRALSAGELQQFLGDNTEALYSVDGEGMLGAPPPPVPRTRFLCRALVFDWDFPLQRRVPATQLRGAMGNGPGAPARSNLEVLRVLPGEGSAVRVPLRELSVETVEPLVSKARLEAHDFDAIWQACSSSISHALQP